MELIWKFDLKTQTQRYKKVKKTLATGFYQKLHFYVLPHLPPKFKDRVVFLPEEDNSKRLFGIHKKRVCKLEKKWKKEETSFLKKINKNFPKLKTFKVFICPTFYGTIGSYEIDKNNIFLFPRHDRGVKSIQKLFINTLVHIQYNNGLKLEKDINSWHKKQELAKLAQEQIVPSSYGKPMTTILDKQFAGKLAKESYEYLQKLGYPPKENIKKPKNLTNKEEKVFDILFAKKNNLVTFDEIADAIWTKNEIDEKYSEYAITKLIERLKKKLPPNIIHPQRGVGYILID